MSESDLSIYGLGQKITRRKLKRFGTLVKFGIPTLMEDEQEKTIQKNKNKKQTSNHKKYRIVHVLYL